MSNPNLRVFPFADQAVGKDGCIYKAGFRSNTANAETGLGLGYDSVDWASESGGTFTYDATDGVIKTSTEGDTQYVKVDYPSAQEVPRAGRGAFQVSIKLSDYIAKAISQNVIRIISTDGANNGIVCKSNFLAEGGASSWREQIDDTSGTSQFGLAVGMTHSGTTTDTGHLLPIPVIHAQTETDADGFFQLAWSWNSAAIDNYINGVFVGRVWRGKFTADAVTPSDFTYVELQAKLAVHMRDLILWDRPFDEINKGSTRVLEMGHSFGVRDNGVYQDRGGRAYGWTAAGTSEQISSYLYKNLTFGINLNNWSESSTNMIDYYDKLSGDIYDAYTDGSGTAQDMLTRQRPHFCLIFGPMYNGGYTGTAVDTTTFADHAAGIHTITDLLMKAGCIPIWIIEQNDDDGASPVDYSTSIYSDVITELNRQQAVNDIGIVDGYTATGGATVDTTLIEDGDAANIHPNHKATKIYAALILSELERLNTNPPDYSRLAGSTEYVPLVIAAP